MKRIGIITIQKCDNFGADLQAYALGAKLRGLGYDAENIDYLFYKHPRHLGGEGEKPVLPISPVNRIKERLFPIVAAFRSFKRFQFDNSNIQKERRRRFADWFAKNVPCGREYRSVASLNADPPTYDVYMAGSDQVWNPRMYSNIKPYFLDFAPAGAHKVSYASSFGVSELPAPAFLNYREWLNSFSHIGLRESRGVELVKRMRLNAEVRHCVDPTLLLTAEDWARVSCNPDVHSSTSNFNSYLLLYDLIACPETVALANRIAKERGLKIVRIGDGAYGPGEFVWLFAHADYVVTNSFHGTAFSILHHKPFNTVIPKSMGNASRITSLLESVGLTERFVFANKMPHADVMTGPVDYIPIDARLDKLRIESVAFLKRAIAGEKCGEPLKSIGDVPKACYAAWNPDKAERAASTSGGLFTILAKQTLSRGGIVYGAAFDSDFKHVHHVRAETVEQLDPIRKSKYVWSDATDAIKDAVEQLKRGREALFVGCPCQCAAMKNAAKGVGEKLTTVDFVCHGSPKPEVFAAYIEDLEKRYGSKVTRYEFRNKDKGWNFQSIYYELANSRKCRVIPWLDPYFHGFSVNAFLRPGCYSCPFATLERVSDISIGDCWRVAASHPQWDDNRGTSLVLGNSEKGVTFLKNCGIDKLPGGEYPIAFAEKRNAALMQPTARFGFESIFFEMFAKTHSFETASSIYMTPKRLLKCRLIYWVKRLGWFYFRHHQ